MNEFKEILQKQFGVQVRQPEKVIDAAPKKAESKLAEIIPKGLGDPTFVQQAQRLFNPNVQVQPTPKAPPATMVDQGVGPSLAGQEGWGAVN